MAAISTGISSSNFLTPPQAVCKNVRKDSSISISISISMGRGRLLKVQAAKIPAGVEVPKVQPKFSEAFLGFTSTAEIWNSRACMIGLIGTFIVELILHKGILEMIGVEIGKGLDIPL